jgi:RNA-binding protein
MKTAHNIIISVFSNEGEDAEKINEALVRLVNLDLEKEKLKVEHEAAEGVQNNKIDIFRIKLEKDRHINSFFENLLSKLGQQQKDLIVKQIKTRIDDDCNFYIRLDKEKLFEGQYHITEKGNCYHIKTLVAAYPKKKEKAVEIVKRLILG